MSTGVLPRQAALYVALRDDLALRDLLNSIARAWRLPEGAERFHSGELAPVGSSLPYVLIAGATARGRAWFGKRGGEGGCTLHVYTPRTEAETTERDVMQVYAELERLLHLTPLPMEGHKLLRGTLSLETILPDPGGTAMHGVCRWNGLTQEDAG